MLWMITKDLINEEGPTNVGVCNDPLAAGLNVRLVPEDQRQGIIERCDTEFRLLDGDDEPYYEGVCSGLDDADGDEAFEPMDRFMNSDGVVSMEYRPKGGKDNDWRQL